ncbi:MAG: ribosome recycling factor [Oscillospiraceae bacterium]|jgi:ribosome recycling factor|nr:ribosome recycling factor [Oscillospiraceae bacterium]
MKEVIDGSKGKMDKCIQNLEFEFSTLRAGRANPGVLEKLSVDYYGVPTAINAMAAVSVQNAQTLVIQPWDKAALKLIEKAINGSDIGITPNNDGTVIRLMFPTVTEERRKELCKHVKKYGEEAKVAVRNVRRDSIDKLKDMKKKSEITEDDLKAAEKDTQKLTDKYVEKIDKICSDKEKEIMTV